MVAVENRAEKAQLLAENEQLVGRALWLERQMIMAAPRPPQLLPDQAEPRGRVARRPGGRSQQGEDQELEGRN
jgi:hypothetical protein